jgi:hypothetical protein
MNSPLYPLSSIQVGANLSRGLRFGLPLWGQLDDFSSILSPAFRFVLPCCGDLGLDYLCGPYTVKRVDEVVRYPHLVTQDQFTQVSKKVFDIPEENFTINIELFRHFSQVWN